jgi:hypothetical protein
MRFRLRIGEREVKRGIKDYRTAVGGCEAEGGLSSMIK